MKVNVSKGRKRRGVQGRKDGGQKEVEGKEGKKGKSGRKTEEGEEGERK